MESRTRDQAIPGLPSGYDTLRNFASSAPSVSNKDTESDDARGFHPDYRTEQEVIIQDLPLIPSPRCETRPFPEMMAALFIPR